MDAAELSNTVWDLCDGVTMRVVRESDVDAVLDVVTRNYEHLRTFMEWAKPDYSLQDAEEWVVRAANRSSEDQPLNMCIFRGNSMIGTIGFAEFDHAAKVTEIGYWIDAEEQGKGIIARATEKMLELAFESLGMNRVQIRCADANVSSAAIPRRFGFIEEGRQRQHVIRDSVIYDFLIFGLLRDEWVSRQNV
jgi:ribosomal-protein-serine acetyltransferase